MSHLWLDPSPWLQESWKLALRGAGMGVCRTWKAGGHWWVLQHLTLPPPHFPSLWEGRNLLAAWM